MAKYNLKIERIGLCRSKMSSFAAKFIFEVLYHNLSGFATVKLQVIVTDVSGQTWLLPESSVVCGVP